VVGYGLGATFFLSSDFLVAITGFLVGVLHSAKLIIKIQGEI